MRGKDIKRDKYTYAGQYIIATFPTHHYNINDYPAIRDYLLDFGKERLEQSGKKNIDVAGHNARKRTNNEWFETQDSISYWDDFNKQKIIYREISEEMNAVLDDKGYLINNKCYIITGEYLKFLCGFFNSNLFKVILKQVNATGGKGPAFIKNLKVHRPLNRDFAPTDKVLYDLYGLSAEEIKFISASVNSIS